MHLPSLLERPSSYLAVPLAVGGLGYAVFRGGVVGVAIGLWCAAFAVATGDIAWLLWRKHKLQPGSPRPTETEAAWVDLKRSKNISFKDSLVVGDRPFLSTEDVDGLSTERTTLLPPPEPPK
jgi:hypothetical protein